MGTLVAEPWLSITLAAVKTDVPGIDGKSYSFVNFFKEMGLQLAPGLKSLKSKEPRVVLSSEQLTLLDSDLILAVDGSNSPTVRRPRPTPATRVSRR